MVAISAFCRLSHLLNKPFHNLNAIMSMEITPVSSNVNSEGKLEPYSYTYLFLRS